MKDGPPIPEGVTVIEPDTPYTPFSSFHILNPDELTLAKWDFNIEGIPGYVKAKLYPPLTGMDEDEPARAPLGITNSLSFEAREGFEDVTFVLTVEPNSIDQYENTLKNAAALFSFGYEYYYCDLTGNDEMLDDEDFHDTEELREALQNGKRRRLNNWVMRQAPGEYYQVTVPRNIDPSLIQVRFINRMSALYLMEMAKLGRDKSQEVKQLNLGLKD